MALLDPSRCVSFVTKDQTTHNVNVDMIASVSANDEGAVSIGLQSGLYVRPDGMSIDDVMQVLYGVDSQAVSQSASLARAARPQVVA